MVTMRGGRSATHVAERSPLGLAAAIAAVAAGNTADTGPALS